MKYINIIGSIIIIAFLCGLAIYYFVKKNYKSLYTTLMFICFYFAGNTYFVKNDIFGLCFTLLMLFAGIVFFILSRKKSK